MDNLDWFQYRVIERQAFQRGFYKGLSVGLLASEEKFSPIDLIDLEETFFGTENIQPDVREGYIKPTPGDGIVQEMSDE